MTNKSVIWSRSWRDTVLAKLKAEEKHADTTWDLIIVGGGITGAGVYREATNLGLKVLLVEQRDFAWGTSSRSSKMVHGGLRYLGSGQFSLANDSVKERQNLMNELPGLVNPLPFIMGHYKGAFPGPWIFDKLLAIYDWMAGKKYRQYFSKGIRSFLVPGIKESALIGATQFSDAVTDDARLVMRVLHAGNQDGGTALNYVRAIDTLKDQNKVSGLTLEDQRSGEKFDVFARAVVNATGTWTDHLRATLGKDKVIRPLRGSHLVIPLWRLPCAFSISFFHPQDKRPVFVFPWEGVCVIGTTDLDHSQSGNSESAIDEQEVAYLLDAANAQFPGAYLTETDIRATWSGVRPVVSKRQNKELDTNLPNKPSDEKREHAIWDDNGMISVAGGKLTTYRLIAMHVLRMAAPYLSGKLEDSDLNRTSHFENSISDLPSTKLSSEAKKRLNGRYGSQAKYLCHLGNENSKLLGKISSTDTLWVELVWACQSESVQHLDDLLLRRTRIGLLLEHGGLALFNEVKGVCQAYLGWDDSIWKEEYERYQDIVTHHYSLPSKRHLSDRGDIA